MKILKALKKEDKIIVNVRVSREEEKKIKENAKRFANGNMSAWMRYIGVNGSPKQTDVTEETPKKKKA